MPYKCGRDKVTANKRWRESNRGEYLAQKRAEGLRRYGLTFDDYAQMLVRQDGRCMICGHPPKKNRLHVDHDHKTGAVRGLLCFRCNRILLGALEHHRHLVERGLLYLDGYLTEPPDEPMTAASASQRPSS